MRLSTCNPWLILFVSGEGDGTPTVNIGPIEISYRTFYVMVMGSLIVIPPNMFIMLFFRRSRAPPIGRKGQVGLRI